MTEISENAARRISTAVTDVERMRNSSTLSGTNLLRTNYGSYLVKTPSGGIPARNGITLGTASCTIQLIDKDNDQISDGESVDVLNVSESAIGGDVLIKATRTKTGDYLADITQVKSGIVRGTSEVDFDDATLLVDIEVTLSFVSGVVAGDIIQTTNWIGYTGDKDGECFAWVHEDGVTFDLMGARCPA
jgi:hypothetical protein